jgi:hypothetical protein
MLCFQYTGFVVFWQTKLHKSKFAGLLFKFFFSSSSFIDSQKQVKAYNFSIMIKAIFLPQPFFKGALTKDMQNK